MSVYNIVIASALLAGASVAQAVELSANLSVQSNYLFRGVTQTDDGAAVSSEIEMSTGSPFYLGTFISNVDFGDESSASSEVDLIAGFGNDIGTTGLSYGIVATYFWYPGASNEDIDYAEVEGSLDFGWFTSAISYIFYSKASGAHAYSEGDLYSSLSVSPPWEYQGFTVSATMGAFQFNDDGNCSACDFNYINWGISVAKDADQFGILSVNYEQVDDENDVALSDGPQFWIGWAKAF